MPLFAAIYTLMIGVLFFGVARYIGKSKAVASFYGSENTASASTGG
jgi:hypothetical protein